jgi:hypothetical protein
MSYEIRLFGKQSIKTTPFSCVLPNPNPDPVGVDNEKHLRAIIGDILVCWGSWGKVLDRAFYVKMILPKPLYCLGKNKDGEPKHPLYLSSDTKLILYQ